MIKLRQNAFIQRKEAPVCEHDSKAFVMLILTKDLIFVCIKQMKIGIISSVSRSQSLEYLFPQ